MILILYTLSEMNQVYILMRIDNDALTELTKLLKFEATFKTTMEPLLRQRKSN